jgi:hypothetical protein
MIESPAYKLRPPLRKPEPILCTKSSQRSNAAVTQASRIYEKLTSSPAPEDPAVPGVSPSRVPPSPPSSISTANGPPERVFFCCVCGKRAVGRVPYGWLRLLRAVHPDSLPGDRLLIRRDRKGRAQYADMLLGTFCGAECMERSMSRLIDLAQDLAARGVGMRPVVPDELPPELPPSTVQGRPGEDGADSSR